MIAERISDVSHCKAPVDEITGLEALYTERYDSWNVALFFDRYTDEDLTCASIPGGHPHPARLRATVIDSSHEAV